jgi:Ala-tRNA(Pro) deacylase
MTIPRHITEFLDSQHVPYRHGTHETRFTAQEIAHAAHVSGKILAKAVMVKAGGRLLMAVLPASHQIGLSALGRLLGTGPARLATEEEFKGLFPDCEVGAMPPIGSLYHLDVWFDVSLRQHATIVFNAGTHHDTLQMSLADVERIVQPHVGKFAWPIQ